MKFSSFTRSELRYLLTINRSFNFSFKEKLLPFSIFIKKCRRQIFIFAFDQLLNNLMQTTFSWRHFLIIFSFLFSFDGILASIEVPFQNQRHHWINCEELEHIFLNKELERSFNVSKASPKGWLEDGVKLRL